MLLNLSLFGTLGLVSIAAAKTITVEVGPSLAFAPDSIIAEVGDEITFGVYPGHSVVEGDGFANPCAFKPGGFFSGFSTSKESFTIAVTSTSPIWLYCSTPTHCQSGMVAVINPP
jgi:plastocyanin